MLPLDREWLERWISARMERMRADTERTRQLLRKSYDQINRSYELLKTEPPKVWPLQPPKEHAPSD
jgi:hypothetical protein